MSPAPRDQHDPLRGARSGMSAFAAARLRRACVAVAVCVLAVVVGCAGPVNPSFDVSLRAASRELSGIERRSIHLERPLVIAAGFLDPGFGVSSLTSRMRRMVDDPSMVVEVAFFSTPTFAMARERMIEKIESLYPSDDPLETIEVDVIGISMGGLVSRYAAAPDEEAQRNGLKRLRIRTLFTLGSPHHGATRADITPAFDERIVDMRSGSTFIVRLNDAWAQRDYDMVAYTRLQDGVVGAANALGPDGTGWWLSPPPFEFSHMAMHKDPRIIADIVRRLTGREPLSAREPAPIPEAWAGVRRRGGARSGDGASAGSSRAPAKASSRAERSG